MPRTVRRMTIPLTVIGGFLGAGKTTLVNHLMRTATRRYGVLVNDFGAINIDAELIGSQDGASVALTNGCVCCSLGDDFGMALGAMAGRTQAPEHIIVEASGISDPWRIAQFALIEPGFELEPLVVIVDAAAVLGQLADRWVADTIERQLAFSEIVLLNKSDLAADLPAVSAAIASRRPEARQLTTSHATISENALHFTPPPRPRPSRLAADTPPGHGFTTTLWRCPGPLDPVRLRVVLEQLPRSVLRVKGFFQVGADRPPTLLQYAAERWAFTPYTADAELVFAIIGTPEMPSAAALAKIFAAALY
jgi:G3E family GTPase